MSELLVPGSVWREKNSTSIEERLRPFNRRLVKVTDAGSQYSTGSRVMGVSYWQERMNGEWIDGDWPGNRRRVGILRRDFLRRFEHLRGPS